MGAIKTTEEMSISHQQQQQEGRSLRMLRKPGLNPDEQKDEERLGLMDLQGTPVIQPNTLDDGKGLKNAMFSIPVTGEKEQPNSNAAFLSIHHLPPSTLAISSSPTTALMSGPLSPIRSPVWKAVGSPISPAIRDDDDAQVRAFEEELKKSLAASTASASPDKTINNISLVGGTGSGAMMGGRIRRQRAMSMIERNLTGSRPFTPFDTLEWISQGSLGVSSAGGTNPGDSPKRSHMEAEELPQLFQTSLNWKGNLTSQETMVSEEMVRNKEEHPDGANKNFLRGMPSLFEIDARGSSSLLSGLPLNRKIGNRTLGEDNSTMEETKRHSSLFGSFLDWAGHFSPQEFSVDEYFMGSSTVRANHNTTTTNNNTTGISSRKPATIASRRHSVAGLNDFYEHNTNQQLSSLQQQQQQQAQQLQALSYSQGHLFGESDLSPDAASFQFRRSGSLVETMASLEGLGGSPINGHGSSTNLDNSSSVNMAAFRDASFHLSSYKGPLYAIEFKAGRTEIFYVLEIDGRPQIPIQVGDLVIVEADRGEDLGKVTLELSVNRLRQLMNLNTQNASLEKPHDDDAILTPELLALVQSKEIIPKRIHRLAQAADLKLLQAKAQEEAIAMVRCQSRIRQKKLPMEVVDAEYQWDRNKLTFYFFSDRRIDFRELVRDLFRIYKTRIWMCAVDKNSPRMQLYNSTLLTSGGIDVCPAVITGITNLTSSPVSPSFLLDFPCGGGDEIRTETGLF